MKRKVISILIVSMMTISCVPMIAFANELAPAIVEDDNAEVLLNEELNSIAEDVEAARDNNGVISKREQAEIEDSYTAEALIKYAQIAEEEAAEVITEEVEDILVSPGTELNLDETYDLDCGAQLRLITIIEDVEDDDSEIYTTGKTILNEIEDYICPVAYADTQSFGTKKFTEKAYVIGAGTVTLTMTAKVKASSGGLKITSGTVSSNSRGWSHDVKTKKDIETEKASAKGKTCKIRGGVQWYDDLYLADVYLGKTSKKWRNMRFSYKVTKINKKSVSYKYSVSRWSTKSW